MPSFHLCVISTSLSFFFSLSRGKGVAMSQMTVLNKVFICLRHLTVKQALEAGNTLLIAFHSIRFLAKQRVPYALGFSY